MQIVVTGMGLLTPFGTDISQVFEKLLAQENAVKDIESFPCEDFPVRFAAEIQDFDPEEYIPDKKKVRQTARYIQYGMAALEGALEMASLPDDSLDPTRIGVLVGSGMGGIDVFQENVIRGHARGPRRYNPFFIPMAISNMQSGFMALENNFQGPNYSISTACATGNHCIIEGASWIERGLVDVVIVGGSESPINESGMGGFAAMKALSTWNDDMEAASRPFDRLRHGFVVGEGSGILVLESLDHAKKRGVEPLAKFMGGGMGCDAYHITSPHPDGEGGARAMQIALDQAQLLPEHVDWINAHGTSTKQGDLAESRAIYSVFKNHGNDILVHSTKSILGHSLGAAASIEAILLIETLRRGVLHPTKNLQDQDPEIKLSIVKGEPMEKKLEIGMSNAFGFGGHNSSVLFSNLP